MKTYPNSPYFDDYNESKQFYRILFRPGRAVQARELTQLQSQIQAQIERFGKGIYKEGSFVTPPKDTYDTDYNYVKLQTTYNSVNADTVLAGLVGQVIVGQTTGVRATVVNYAASTTGGDPPTVYVKYLNSGTNGTTTAFADNEVINNAASTVFVRALSSSATGTGTAFSTGTAVLFAKGNFLYVDQQTLIVEKYGQVTDRIIGFTITESEVTSNDDSSLLDPAVGSSNYFAPGADRYKIALTLSDRPFTPTVDDDENFVEVLRVQDGEIISRSIDPRLSVIGDTLARRTYDESGDYIVKPFNISLYDHLRTTNAASEVGIVRDGLYTATEGGNTNLFVNIITDGKAYVRGYEVENFVSTRVVAEKARDYSTVNNGTVATQLSSYIEITGAYSTPALDVIPQVVLYSDYIATPGIASGTRVGTAKARGLEYVSGNVTALTAEYKLYLFDIVMDSGYSFERDAKSVFSDNAGFADFTSNIIPTAVSLTGSISTTSGSNVITGVGTRFTSELDVGDYITINSEYLKVGTITNSTSLITTTNASASSTGQLYTLNTSTVKDANKDTFIIEFPYSVIKSVDSTNIETSYTTKRYYSRTLSGNTTTITAGTNETFAPFSDDNYSVIVASGGRAGEHIELNNTIVTRGGTPTGATLTVDLSSEGLTTETIKIITTVNKANSAAVKKSKTLVSDSTVDFTSQADAQASIISLGKADIFKLTSVKMSNVAFGSSFVEAGSIDITDRYTLDNGQRSTYYGLGTLSLKPGQPKPTNPIRVTFDYFTHGSGDYFSVSSYSGISYSAIPEVTIGNKTYKLRDCLDFRPRINDAGTGFSGSGASATEFIDPEVDLLTDYEYYLPRIDKLVVDKDGLFYHVKGISSLNPKEPTTPDGTLCLYLLKQQPYVFDLVKDVDINVINNRRYTMRDINKIENRVKNLEYYTSLSLLERDAQQAQIKDSLGFERFKNGFLVDSFTGHGVGDSVNNPDYSVSVNYRLREASPLVTSKFLPLVETATTTGQRTSNNYALTGDVITLPYTEEVFLENKYSSKTEYLNPFNVVVFNGFMRLDPPSDLWFDDRRAPDIQSDQKNNFDSLSSFSLVKKDGNNVFGSINDIEQFRFGTRTDSFYPEGISLAELTDAINPSASSIDVNGEQVIINTAVVPKMRDVTITFEVDGLRPNTKMFAYFDNENVTNFCLPIRPEVEAAITAGNTALTAAITEFRSGIDSPSASLPYDISTPENIASVRSYLRDLITDNKGTLKGTFSYRASTLNMNTGRKIFRLTNSSTNNYSTEGTFAEALFVSDGVLRELAGVRPPPPPPPPPVDLTDESSGYVEPAPAFDGLQYIYSVAFGRNEVDAEGRAYWEARASRSGVDLNDSASLLTSRGKSIIKEIIRVGASETKEYSKNGVVGQVFISTNNTTTATTTATNTIVNSITTLGSIPSIR